MKTNAPLACNMNVFTPAQREVHTQNTIELIRGVQSVRDIENGYEIQFPNETSFISKLAEFISNERLCCPFLEFSLNVISNDEPITLKMTGPAGTAEFLRAEFGGAIS